MSMEEKVKEFDRNGELRRKIDESLERLKHFREKYPFKDDPDSIDKLTADDIFNKGENHFFKWLEFTLRPLGRIALGGGPNACRQLEKFKDLLRIAVDEEKSLAEKVDAPWEKIRGMGGDKHIAKKIISCYDDNVLPIFDTDDLEYFFNLLVGKLNVPSNYDNMTLGEKYQYLTQALISVKESNPEAGKWDNPYFMRFLYEMYPPQRRACLYSWLKRKIGRK